MQKLLLHAVQQPYHGIGTANQNRHNFAQKSELRTRKHL